MVVTPWILPLRVAVFAILIGQARLLSRSLITLVTGAGITLTLSMGLGLIARSQGLLVVEDLQEQIVAWLEPNTFDLGIALAAGAIATYAKVNPGAVSSMAVTAIANAELTVSSVEEPERQELQSQQKAPSEEGAFCCD